uniref:Cuticular protein n=1 Tax=Nilaparvata lugens TaxID=108931 RepID=A0A2S1ZS24_NILLU|nr:cuticular protein [Nilaparvata lugens]
MTRSMTTANTNITTKHDDEEHDDGQYHHHHDHDHDHDHGKWDIRHSVPGEPTVDYPVLAAVPSTTFTCTGLPQGYYADKEARCQVFHVCSTPPLIIKSSFLCPNGSIFSQEHSVCEWWNMVNCTGEIRRPDILPEPDIANKIEANDTSAVIQSFTDDKSMNSNQEQNKVIETDPGDTVMDLDDNGGAGILAITNVTSQNNNSNRTVFVSSMLNDSSLYYEEKKKGMVEAAKEENASNAADNNKMQIVPSVDDTGYNYEGAAQKNVSFSLDDYSSYNKYDNKSQITTSNKDESGFSLENVKTQGYVYETPKTPLTYPTTVSTLYTTSTPDFHLDFDLEPRRSDGDEAITSFESKTKSESLDAPRTNLDNQQINSINEGFFNAFTPTTPSTSYDVGYDYSRPSTTFSPSSPTHSTFGYSYSPPSTAFSYPNEIKQSNDLKTRYQEDTRYTTAKFPSSTVYPDTFKTQTPADFPSTTLSPPTFNQNPDTTFGVTEASPPNYDTTPSPVPEKESNAGISQNIFSGIDSADKTFNFNSLSVSNDGGSGLIDVGSSVQTPPTPLADPSQSSITDFPSTGAGDAQSFSAAPSQNSNTDFSNTGTGGVQSTTTPPFRGFSGEPFSIKSTTDFPFDNKDLVSQISQTFEDENGTVITRVDFKFASENKTTSEETNSFENKTVTRVITLPSSDLPSDDFLNELNSLSQSELRVEPSSIEFDSSFNPNFIPSSQDTTEASRKEASPARFTTATPVATTSRDEKQEQTPSKLLIPLSNYQEQGSIETSKNSIPNVEEFGSLERYRVKTKPQNTKSPAYYPNKQEYKNLNNYQSQNFQSAQVAITQRTPTYDLKFNNAFVSQPYAFQPSVPRNYQPTQNSQYQNHQQDNVNLLSYILRTNLAQQSYYPQQSYFPQQNYHSQQNYHAQQPLFNPYLQEARLLLNSGLVNNLDLTKMNYLHSNNNNYNSAHSLNSLFTANNQAQSYSAPQQQHKYEQRSFQADIVPSVSFDFDSNEGIKEFNLAVSTGIVRRKKRYI